MKQLIDDLLNSLSTDAGEHPDAMFIREYHRDLTANSSNSDLMVFTTLTSIMRSREITRNKKYISKLKRDVKESTLELKAMGCWKEILDIAKNSLVMVIGATNEHEVKEPLSYKESVLRAWADDIHVLYKDYLKKQPLIADMPVNTAVTVIDAMTTLDTLVENDCWKDIVNIMEKYMIALSETIDVIPDEKINIGLKLRLKMLNASDDELNEIMFNHLYSQGLVTDIPARYRDSRTQEQ